MNALFLKACRGGTLSVVSAMNVTNVGITVLPVTAVGMVVSVWGQAANGLAHNHGGTSRHYCSVHA